ncbi:MAG: sulfate adenylyltransferase subunit CysD [Bacteroidia bacterium]|nr:sulfate adenylyltransferase subunit CysD [Bacteroidia bacterium]
MHASPAPARLDHLRQLEAESIYILREVAGQFDRPAILFSGGKDSITVVRLAQKAFWPAPIPFPLLHIDTGHNFPETLAFRDRLVAETGATLLVRSVEDSLRQGRVVEPTGRYPSRNALQSVTLLDAIEELRFDACIGGARRDEEKARAKERIFSVRSAFGEWNPKRQRPELWSLYNGRIQPGENVRVFPISNWTELDVWQYIAAEGLALPSIYFAHTREVIEVQGQLMATNPYWQLGPEVTPRLVQVRFRTVGDMTCTAAVPSAASTLEEVVAEIRQSRLSERGARMDDKTSEAAMEERKSAGYF